MSPRTRHHVGGGGDRREAVITRASDVRIRSIKFLWFPWVPLGKVTLLAGAPGQGKSQLTAFFAAMTSVAGFDPSDVMVPGQSVILTAEDDLDDTVVPRLMAAGADLERVEFISMRHTMPSGITADGLIKLPGDIDTLHGRLKRGDVRLVVFDPVASFVGREHSTYINQDVRDLLDPLAAFARAYEVAIVVVLHLNKSEAKTWAQKIAESHAFQAVARSVLALAGDPEDEDGDEGTDKIMAATKLNVARRSTAALRFRLMDAMVYDADNAEVATSKLELIGTAAIHADDLLASREQNETQQIAREWLEDFLGDDWHKVSETQAAAIKDGHSWRTIERVRKDICQKQKQPGVEHGPWWIALKGAPSNAWVLGSLDGVGGVEGDKAAKTAKTAQDPKVEKGGIDPDENGNVAHLRERDRRLGERWEDE